MKHLIRGTVRVVATS